MKNIKEKKTFFSMFLECRMSNKIELRLVSFVKHLMKIIRRLQERNESTNETLCVGTLRYQLVETTGQR